VISNIVKIDLYKEDELIKYRCIDINEWYDGSIVEVDSNKYRVSNKITAIKGTQYGSNGQIEETWSNYYDDFGRLVKTERYDSEHNLIDREELSYDITGKIMKN
jgi:hypothetical protein